MESNANNGEVFISLGDSTNEDSIIGPLDDIKCSRLPILPEIWRIIFNHLNMKDLKMLSLTCAKFEAASVPHL